MVSVSTTIKNLRLSKISASAPAGSANRQIGKVLAACTSATISGSGLSVVINQPDAALYIQPPTLDTNVAVQITANTGWRNGAAKIVGELAPAALLIVVNISQSAGGSSSVIGRFRVGMRPQGLLAFARNADRRSYHAD